jgi:hypothetical protein
MAHQLRIQNEGAIYHLMSRGDRRDEIFGELINTLPRRQSAVFVLDK